MFYQALHHGSHFWFWWPVMVAQTFQVPLYYTGEAGSVLLAHEDGPAQSVVLARDYSLPITVTLGPRGVTFYVFSRVPEHKQRSKG